MARRITSIIYLLIIVLISSSAFKFYVDYDKDKNNVPAKYDKLQEEYDKKKDQVLEENKQIYANVLKQYQEMGGDTSALSSLESRRFLLGMEPDDPLLSSIDHEPLHVVDMEEPPSGNNIMSLEAEDVAKLQDDIKFKFIVHGFILFIASLMYLILLLVFGKKKRASTNTDALS